MTPPPPTSDEFLRLEALHQYAVLDTPSEPALDDLTALAARLCEAPISLISFIDVGRQWFKSKVGLVPAETARDISFCGHAILEPDLFIVPDTEQDARFADNPMVTGESGIRFYAGAPLRTPAGRSLGALCVMDRVPRQLTSQQQETLRVLGRQVMSQLELRRQTRELAETEERLRVVTENAHVGLGIVNRDRRYAYANRTYTEMLGLPSPAILGLRVAEVLTGVYEEQIRPRLDRAFGGERVSYELHTSTADGDRHYAVRYEPMVEEGTVRQVVVVLTDITARKQAEDLLEEAVRFAQSTIDALSAHVCVLDEEGTILATNENWRRFAELNPPMARHTLPGDNYLRVCDEVSGPEKEEAQAFAAGIRATVSGEHGAEFTMEYPCHSPSEKRWFVGRVTRFSSEGAVRMVVAHENITQRKQAEIVSARLAAIVASSDDAIISKDLDGNITSWNGGAEKIFGYTSREMVGISISRLIPPDRIEEEEQILVKIRRGETIQHFETRRRTKEGRLIDVSVTISPIKDAVGEVIGVSKVAREITERKRVERALRESEELFSAAFRSSPVAIAINRRRDLVNIEVNEAFLRMHECTREDIFGKTLLDAWLLDAKTVASLRSQLSASGSVLGEEVEARTRTGKVLHLNLSIKVIQLQGEECALAILVDITRRKQAEQALRASEGRYRTLFEYAPDGIVIADPESRYLDANASACRMLGYPREELIGLHATDIVVPAEVEHIGPALSVIKAGTGYHREWQFRRKDGSVFPAEVMATMMPDGNLLGMIRDITERKRSEARFHRLVDSNVQGVMFAKNSGEVTGANDAFLQIVGYSREDLEAGRINWAALTPPDYAEADRRSAEELVARGVCAPYEKEYLRKNGSRVPVLIGVASFEDSPEEGVCFVVDLTERKKLEQQFLRAQRMESIGTLAGGIAHDLNNMLSPIMMSLALLEMRFPDSASRELLSMISSSAQRCADMVRQVLSFARGVEGRRMELQVKHLVRDIEKIANDTFLKHIQVRTVVPNELWTVLGDPTQLHQVLLNLCVNARDAMPYGGTLTFSASNIQLDAQYAALNLEAKPGSYVLLQVEDSGTGMSPAVIEKIFDPFFTTKEVGKGTGLGLSTTLAIVKSHGGFIEVYSEVGRGTKFKVYLPAKTERSEAEIAETATEMPRGHGELILVVDDEVSVREITKQTLEAFGYRVVLAADGVEAVTAYASRGSEIAVVLTDMMMPIMDGPATIQVLRKMNPKVALIAASGLAANAHIANAASLGVKHFLPKPYTAEVLLKLLRQVISGKE